MSKVLSAVLVTLGLLLLTAGQAHAAAQCNAGPINEAGDINIAPSFPDVDCVVAGDVTGGGYIRINAPLGKITITGSITTTNHGNIVLSAGGPVSVGGSVIVNNAAAPSGQSGNVDIQANMSQAGAPFVIGGASSNGVANTIDVSTAAGGGNDPFIIKGGIRVRNRGDITVVSPTALSVKATASKAGVIILDSVDGTLFLPAGTLSADGQPGQSAGAIVLMSHAIVAQDGTIISASDDGTAKLSHFVNIATESISYSGALTVRSNGGGSSVSGTGSFVYALPEFGIQIFEDSAANPGNFTWIVTYPFGTAGQRALTWDGAAGAPLTVTANGNTNTQLLMSGYPLTFNGGDTLLASRGQQNHALQLTYTGATTGINGLQVNASKLTLNANANANAGTGGDVFIGIPKPVSSSPQQVLVTADGPTNAAGDGGTIDFFANGDITLGSAAGQFHLSAQGGTPGGNGGFANVQNAGHATNMATATAVQVSARGGNGDGGSFTAHSLTMSFAGSGLKVSADALGTGKGGQILWDVDGPISVGTGAGQVRLSADADAMVGGDGGQISIEAGSAEITAGQLTVKSGPMASGGSIGIFTDSDLSLTGSLKADAGSMGNGNGGAVTVVASGQLILNGSSGGGGQSLSADGAGTGSGGSVSLTVEGNFAPTTIAKGQQGAVSLSADGGNNGLQPATYLGAGGTIALTDLNEGFVINGAAISVKSGSGKNAGTITVDAGQTLAVSGDIQAHGIGTGANGGTISLTADSVNPVVFSGTSTTNIIADGGSTGTTANAGHITISNSGTGDIKFQQKAIISAAAEGTSGGEAGTISISTGGSIVFEGVDNTIKANGNGLGIGAGDNIRLHAPGGIKTPGGPGSVEFLANGGAPGMRGGNVSILSSNGEVSVGTINAKAGSNANGGSVTVESQANTTITGGVNAFGRGNGSGGVFTALASGNVTIISGVDTTGGCNDGDGGPVTISGNNLSLAGIQAGSGNQTCVAVAAFGIQQEAQPLAPGSGTPAPIVIEPGPDGNVDLSGDLDTHAQGSAGGGLIEIKNKSTRPIDIQALGKKFIAKGGPTGIGGTVKIAYVINFPDYRSLIDVNPGDAMTDVSKFAGKIVVKGVTCQQWKIGGNPDDLTGQPRTAWPFAYWDCTANAASPTAKDKLAPKFAVGPALNNVRSQLSNVEIFVFAGGADYNNFFPDPDVLGGVKLVAGGVTAPYGQHIYSAPWQSGSIGSPNYNDVVSYDDAKFTEVSAHEIGGHVVDIALATPQPPQQLPSRTTLYNDYVLRDVQTLDFADFNSVRRLPCAKTPINPNDLSQGYYPGQIPFEGVLEPFSGEMICVDGHLNDLVLGKDDQGNPLHSWDPNAFPSQVLTTVDPGLWNPNPNDPKAPPRWVEPHAQAFAIGAVTERGSRPVNDAAFDRGYFPCLKSWAQTERSTGAIPTGACNLTPSP